MKRLLLTPVFFTPLFLSSQESAPLELLSPKPKIEVNGIICSIGYEQFTCVPATCDSVIINEGDSILFCSGAYTELNVPGYYLQWDFNGSSLGSVTDSAISSTPVCYLPFWNVAGVYDVSVYYLGSQSVCCCNDVPSEWNIRVVVLPVAGLVDEELKNRFTIQQSHENILLATEHPGNYRISVFTISGTQIFSSDFSSQVSIATAQFPSSLLLLQITELSSLVQTSFRLINQ